MAASDRQIRRDSRGQPALSIYDPAADEFQHVLGTQGRQHVILYHENGEPVDIQNRDLRGLLADRPEFFAVEVGTTYWAVDRIGQADEVTVSDGVDWKPL